MCVTINTTVSRSRCDLSSYALDEIASHRQPPRSRAYGLVPIGRVISLSVRSGMPPMAALDRTRRQGDHRAF
jgi:hypothetical protein